jgi:CPA2 family monovalent cation:H+ antiporter-2
MFQAGTELSWRQLRRMQRFTLLGPAAQLLLTVPLVALAVWLTRRPVPELSYLALILGLSSTTVIIKLMAERGELDTLHGRLAIPFSIVQDLPMIPAIVIISSLPQIQAGASPWQVTWTVLAAVGKAVGFVVVAYSLGVRVVPPLLRQMGLHGREVFLLCAVALALGMAYVTNLLGLSLALGAFIAGLLVADSVVSHQVLREVSPLSDIFVTFFFVSVGMLLDIPFVLSHLHGVALLVLLIVVGKALLLTLVGLLFRYSGKTALLMGLTLAQIGEEAFLLSQVGLSQGLLSASTYSLVLAGAVLSIVLNPVLVALVPRTGEVLGRLPVLRVFFRRQPQLFSGAQRDGLWDHTIICGFGHVGQGLAQVLEREGLPYLVIDLDPERVHGLREKKVPCIFGDASSEAVLAKAYLHQARMLAVTVPDGATVERLVRNARKVRQGIEIVVRASGDGDSVSELREAGATEVVHPSFEASLEFMRSVLRGNGVPARDIERLVLTRRLGFYG